MYYLNKIESFLDGLVQERRNTIALTMELRIPCSNPSMCYNVSIYHWSYWYKSHLSHKFYLDKVESYFDGLV